MNKADGFAPIFFDVVAKVKGAMDKSGGNGHLTAAYVFGVAWANEVYGIFSPNKSQIAKQVSITTDTLNKYLTILCDCGLLKEIDNGSAYIVSESGQFRFTLSVQKPVIHSAEHVGTKASADMLGHVPSMSAQIAEHVGNRPPYNNNNINIQDMDTEAIGMNTAIKAIWSELGLDTKGNAYKNCFNIYQNESCIENLLELSIIWLKAISEGYTIDLPLLYTLIKNGTPPPTSEKQETWFTHDELQFFEVSG